MDRLKEMIELLAPWKFWVDVSAASFAVCAAITWFRASVVKTPKVVRHVLHMPMDGPFEGDVADAVVGLHKQSILNAWAAAFSGVAAILTAVSVLIGTRWG
jgi:hypothetical protein